MAGFLSTREAAARLGVTPQHLRRLIESGQLVAQRVGHRYVVDGDSLETLHAARQAMAQLAPGTLAQIAEAERMLARFPWDAIREAQRVIAQFRSTGAALPAGLSPDATVDATPAWQEWAGSSRPQDAIAKLRARAQARTRAAGAEHTTEILRALRAGRHTDG